MRINSAKNILINILSSSYDKREALSVAGIYFEDRFGANTVEKTALTPDEENLFYEDLKRFEAGEPVQYITGKTYFYKYFFELDKNVLIPRQETELLVYHATQFCNEKNTDIQILDIGTGSGCIALSIAAECPNAIVTAVDISDKALEIAKKNRANLKTKNVDFVKMDFLDEEKWSELDNYDLIISNPPYIHPDEKKVMSHSTLQYEPEIALFPQDNDHLVFYKKILNFGLQHLKSKGKIICELNEFALGEITELIKSYDYFYSIHNDFYDKPRILECKKN